MTKNVAKCLASAALLVSSTVVLADAPKPNLLPDSATVTGSASIVTDYRDRGMSLSGDSPAVMGGIDVQLQNGLNAGVSAATVDLGDSNMMVTAGIGYKFDIDDSNKSATTDRWANIGYEFHRFPSENDLDYHEVSADLFADYRALGRKANGQMGISVSDDYYGEAGWSFYPNFSHSLYISNSLSFDTHLGYLMTEEDFGSETRILDYSVGLTQEFSEFDVSLSWVDTNRSDSKCFASCEDSVVLGISKAL